MCNEENLFEQEGQLIKSDHACSNDAFFKLFVFSTTLHMHTLTLECVRTPPRLTSLNKGFFLFTGCLCVFSLISRPHPVRIAIHAEVGFGSGTETVCIRRGFTDCLGIDHLELICTLLNICQFLPLFCKLGAEPTFSACSE